MNARSTTNRRWGRTTLVTVAAFLGILAIGGSVALATIPGSGGAISACYNTGSNPSGQLRVIDADAGVTCSKNEKVLSWNQTGSQGPQGPQGPQGAKGDTGPQGLKGDTGPQG